MKEQEFRTEARPKRRGERDIELFGEVSGDKAGGTAGGGGHTGASDIGPMTSAEGSRTFNGVMMSLACPTGSPALTKGVGSTVFAGSGAP